MKSIIYENHDAYLLYQAALERYPICQHTATYPSNMYLYYKAYPEERSKDIGTGSAPLYNFQYLPVVLLPPSIINLIRR